MQRKVKKQSAWSQDDLTRIIPGSFKGVAFKKGHIIRSGDIPALWTGKETILFRHSPGQLHENDAAERLAQALRGDHHPSGPAEGKSSLISNSRSVKPRRRSDLDQPDPQHRLPFIIMPPARRRYRRHRIILTVDERSIVRAKPSVPVGPFFPSPFLKKGGRV
jgi:hypothetical protein